MPVQMSSVAHILVITGEDREISPSEGMWPLSSFLPVKQSVMVLA